MKWIVFWVLLVSYTSFEKKTRTNEYGIKEYFAVKTYHEVSHDTLRREFATQDSAIRFIAGSKKYKIRYALEPYIDTIWIERRDK